MLANTVDCEVAVNTNVCLMNIIVLGKCHLGRITCKVARHNSHSVRGWHSHSLLETKDWF
jgi:hypothetical protein